MARQRIALIEFFPHLPAQRQYATWNPADAGAGVALSGGNLRILPATATSDGGVRATVAPAAGIWRWETRIVTWSQTGFALQVGMSTSLHPINSQIGSDLAGQSMGYNAFDGSVRRANTTVGNIGAVVAGDVIRHRYDASRGRYEIARNGGAWLTVVDDIALTTQAWFPAAFITRGKEIIANFGQTPFVYPLDLVARPGLYFYPAQATTTLRVGTAAFNEGAIHFMPRIPVSSDVVTRRSASAWLIGGQSQSSRGSVLLLNGDRRLDDWSAYDWYEARYRVLRGYKDDQLKDFTVYASGLVDQQGWDGARNVVITLADPLKMIDRPVQTSVYPVGYPNPQAVSNPLPLALGRPLGCEGVLRTIVPLSTDANTIDFTDRINGGGAVLSWMGSLVGADVVYDRGNPFAAPPLDWDVTADRAGIRLVNDPDGPVVANLRAGVEPLGAAAWSTDFVAAGVVPAAGWTKTGAETTTRRIYYSGGARFVGDGTGTVQLSRGATSVGGIYMYQVRVSARSSGYVALRIGTTVIRQLDSVGMLVGYVTAATAGALNLAVVPASGTTDVTIAYAYMQPVELVERLPVWVRHVLVTRMGLDPAMVDFASAQAIDAEAPYRLAHYTKTAQSALALLRQTMDSFCGWLTTNRQGQITFGRLQRPGAPVVELTDLNIRSVKRGRMPLKGASTRLAGRRWHRVHSAGELADSVDAAVSIRPRASAAVRAEMTSEYGCIRSYAPSTLQVTGGTNNRLTPAYRHAEAAPPQATLLQEDVDVQREINRVGDMSVGSPDAWPSYEVDAILEATDADLIETGSAVALTSSFYGVSRVVLLVLDVTTRAVGRSVQMLLVEVPE